MRRLAVFIVLCFFFFSGNLDSSASKEEIGTVLPAAEGEKLFGKVMNFAEIDIKVLFNSVNRADQILMFGLYEGRGVVTKEAREVLFPDLQIPANFVLHVFSKSVVERLLSKEPGAVHFYIEQREKAFTIRINNWMMEYSTPCPPFC